MTTITFKTEIAADKKKVWNTMLQPDTYKEWAGAGWPGSTYVGKWEKGEKIRFVSVSGGGTKAVISTQNPYEEILAEHIAVIRADGSEDTDSEFAKGWVGTLERYLFNTRNNKTELLVEIKTAPEWVPMFNEGWPIALAKLKEICEQAG